MTDAQEADRSAAAKEATHSRDALGAASLRVVAAAVIALLVGVGATLALTRSDSDEGPTASHAIVRLYRPSQQGNTVLSGDGMGASVTIVPGTLRFLTRMMLSKEAPEAGPSPPTSTDPGYEISVVSPYFDVITRSTGNNGLNFDPPLQVVIGVPATDQDVADSELIACYYLLATYETDWKPIPKIDPSASLSPNQRDGFFIRHVGARREVHILTRHLTRFAVFEKRPAGQ